MIKHTQFPKMISLIVALMSLTCLLAQKPQPYLVMAEDFLGENAPDQVYDIRIDTSGLVYMVYPGYLWRFNGASAKTKWKHKNPYDPIVFTRLHEGYNHKLLLSGPFNIAYLKGDSIINYPIPDSISKSLRRGLEVSL